MRTAFIETLCELAARDDRIWLVCGDLGYSVLERFAERFPQRFLNAGVAEQNMMGMAAGLAMTGKTVFVYSIANFPTLRCYEQIRNDVCYHKAHVIIAAVGGGFAYGPQGYTHHGVEDLAALRLLPNMSVMAPADPVETSALLPLAVAHAGPSYIRLGKAGEEKVHGRGLSSLTWGRSVEIRQGRDAAILCTGSIVTEAVRAAARLQTQGYDVGVYSFPWLAPFDGDGVRELAQRYPLLVSLEEGRVSGGLGGAVAETVAALSGARASVIRLGVDDRILENARSQVSARRELGMDADAVCDTITRLCRPAAASRT